MIPKVSVIVPNYNHEKYIVERLQTIFNQSFQSFECLVLDDCSTDGSRLKIDEYAAKEKRCVTSYNSINSGNTFTQWRKGIANSKGQYIWIAESDDAAEPQFLQELVDVLEADPKVVLAYSQSHRYNENNEITGDWKSYTDDLDNEFFNKSFVMDGVEYIQRFLIHRNTIPNASAVVFRRSVYEKISGVSDNFKTNGDWLTWLKMLCYGKVAYIDKPLNYFRFHSQSVIARAHHHHSLGVYSEAFDGTMRKEFVDFVKKRKIHLSKSIKIVNANFIALEERKKGLYLIKVGQYLKGWRCILSASFYPKIQFGYIKTALINK